MGFVFAKVQIKGIQISEGLLLHISYGPSNCSHVTLINLTFFFYKFHVGANTTNKLSSILTVWFTEANVFLCLCQFISFWMFLN